MKKILVTAHDTEIGKTWIMGALARRLTNEGKSVSIVKAVESGVPEDEPGDARWAAQQVEVQERVAADTLFSFDAPMAPVKAAKLEGADFGFDIVVDALNALEDSTDVRLIEGAGGIAVPLEDGPRDYAALAQALEVDAVVLVVQNRLGAINQSRLTYAYAKAHGLNAGIMLVDSAGEIDPGLTESHYEGLEACNIPIWGHIGHKQFEINNCAAFYG